MWELNHKDGWTWKNWCFWTVVLEKTLESSLDCKEIQPVHPKGNQSWIFSARTDAEAETPILWPPDVQNWIIGKDPDAEKDWRQEEKGTIENEIFGWHHWIKGHESEQLLEMVKDREVWCASVHGVTKSDKTERLNWASSVTSNYIKNTNKQIIINVQISEIVNLDSLRSFSNIF